MHGITIIEEHLCRVVELPELIGAGIFVTLLAVGVLLLYKLMWKYNSADTKRRDRILTVFCSVLLVIMYIVFWAVQISNYNKTHVEYTVTVDDSVSFNDFHAKYEIVSVNGNEYRIVER